jgi:hypothetical protein
MSIKVKKEVYVKAPDKYTAKCMSQHYVNGRMYKAARRF